MTLGVTLDELYQYLDQVPGSPNDNVRLEQLMAEAERVVEDILNPVVYGAYGSATTQDVAATLYAQPFLALPTHQAGSVTAVVKVANRGGDEALTTIADYAMADHGRLYRALLWMPATYYRVTAVWGAGPAPRSARHVVYMLTVNTFRAKDRGFFSEAAGDAGGGGVRFTGGVPREARQILERLRRNVLGASL